MEKNSKVLRLNSRNKMWALYCKDNKGFATFEKYCEPVANIMKHVTKKAYEKTD